MKKLLALIAFSVLVLIPVGTQNAFAVPPVITVVDKGASIDIVATDSDNMSFIEAANEQFSKSCTVNPSTQIIRSLGKTSLPVTVTAKDCSIPPEQTIACVATDLSVTPGACSFAVGGELIPLDTTMILVAGTQYTAAWMIPVLVSAVGIGIVIARKF